MVHLRDIIKMQKPNDGSRTLTESIVNIEVIEALNDWKKTNQYGVLIGGLALSYHAIPRMTQDIDFLILTTNEIPNNVPGFKHIRQHSFQHNKTHVLIDLITPEYKNIPVDIAKKVIETAIIDDNGVKIATAEGIIVIKLFRLNRRDQADIIALLQINTYDLSCFNLPENQQKAYDQLIIDAKTDPI